MSNKIQYINLINRYFNQGCLTRSDKLFSYISNTYPFNANVDQISKIWQAECNSPAGNLTLTSILSPYTGKNKGVEGISEFLINNLSDSLFGAYLHGSLATNEEIAYSDFDGLLILKNEVYQSKERISEVAKKISKAYSLMISIDPLQHHGWFIVSESDLSNWPVTFFPPELFEYCKSLLPNSRTLSIQYSQDSAGSLISLNKIIFSLEKSLTQKPFPSNLYQLKSLFSEFMLLPTLYLQAKTNKGIYKKFSFETADKFFHPEKWSIMNEISYLRSIWPSRTSNLLIPEPCLVTPSLKKQQIRKSLPIPKELSSAITPDFKNRMQDLVQLFKIAS